MVYSKIVPAKITAKRPANLLDHPPPEPIATPVSVASTRIILRKCKTLGLLMATKEVGRFHLMKSVEVNRVILKKSTERLEISLRQAMRI